MTFDQISPPLSLRASGPLAIFTRPEFKAERMSYPVMTPSAARGLLEAVLWKPAIMWCVLRITVLKPIEFTAFRRNEVNSRAVAPKGSIVREGGAAPVLYADEDRAQRNTVALRDVDYVIEGRFQLTERAGPGDNVNKFVDMFRRRVEKGQHFHQPYFGCRECVADITPVDGRERPIDDTRELGLMLWDIAYSPAGNRPIFFQANLVHGVLEVPTDPQSALVTSPSPSVAIDIAGGGA
jgi:CRISPR-associated protein Cas5d